MLSTAELKGLRTQVEQRSSLSGVGVLSPKQALLIIDQAIEDRQTINRWFGFLKLMAARSSWSEQINDLLNAYLFGTESKEVQAAALRYAEMSKLHERSIKR